MNYYEVLGVSADATDQQIKEAYRREAMKWHPDRHDGVTAKAHAERRFKDLALAYRTLRDHTARAEYGHLLKQKLQQEYEDRQREQARAEHERSQARQRAEQAQQAKSKTSRSNPQQPKQDEPQDYAQQMFFEQMLDLAFELAGRKFPEAQIVKALIALGCPDAMAIAVSNLAIKGKKYSSKDQPWQESRTSEGPFSDKTKPSKIQESIDADLQLSWEANAELFQAALVGLNFVPMDDAQYKMIRLVRVILFISVISLIASLFWIDGIPKDGAEVFSNFISAALIGWGLSYGVLHLFATHRHYICTARAFNILPIFKKIHFKIKSHEVNDAFIFPIAYYGYYGILWPLVAGVTLIVTLNTLILLNTGPAVHNQKFLLNVYEITQNVYFYPAIWLALGYVFYDLLFIKINKSIAHLQDDPIAASKIFNEHGPKLWRAYLTAAVALLVLSSPSEFIFPDANERLIGAYKAQKMTTQELHKIGSGRFQKPIADAAVSEKVAHQYLTISAERGFKDSQALLGYIYLGGFGNIKQDDQWARHWIEKAAQQNDAWSMAALGDMHRHGSHGLQKNDHEAVRHWLKSAESGHAYGMSQIGLAYSEGYGGVCQERWPLNFQAVDAQGDCLCFGGLSQTSLTSSQSRVAREFQRRGIRHLAAS